VPQNLNWAAREVVVVNDHRWLLRRVDHVRDDPMNNLWMLHHLHDNARSLNDSSNDRALDECRVLNYLVYNLGTLHNSANNSFDDGVLHHSRVLNDLVNNAMDDRWWLFINTRGEDAFNDGVNDLRRRAHGHDLVPNDRADHVDHGRVPSDNMDKVRHRRQLLLLERTASSTLDSQLVLELSSKVLNFRANGNKNFSRWTRGLVPRSEVPRGSLPSESEHGKPLLSNLVKRITESDRLDLSRFPATRCAVAFDVVTSVDEGPVEGVEAAGTSGGLANLGSGLDGLAAGERAWGWDEGVHHGGHGGVRAQ